MPELRPYQARALDDVRAEFQRGSRSVVVVAPTGAGKTVMMAEIARRTTERGGRVLIVVHRRELAMQVFKHLGRAGLSCIRVLVAGVSRGPHDAPVTVAAIQTLTGKIWRNRMPAASLVMIDEAHHIVAPSFMSVRNAYPDAFVIGFTATPERSDRSPLGDVFEAMVVVATIRELTDQGFLVPCEVWAPSSDRRELAADPVDAYIERGEGKRAIVFCASVEHARGVATGLVAHDVAAEHVDGSMAARDRDAALSRFASGATHVITNCNLITEGFDVPAAKCVVLARGCSSVALYLQAVGRALRPEPGERHALLIDLRGAVHRHGLPDADREFSLHGRPIRALTCPEQIRQCPSCGAVFERQAQCPSCGAELGRPTCPRIVEAELERIDRSTPPDIKRAKYAELLRLAKQRGFKPGWAFYRFRHRFGHAPEVVP